MTGTDGGNASPLLGDHCRYANANALGVSDSKPCSDGDARPYANVPCDAEPDRGIFFGRLRRWR